MCWRSARKMRRAPRAGAAGSRAPCRGSARRAPAAARRSVSSETLPVALEREQREHEADEERAGVAQEDARRREVVGQEAEQRADQRDADAARRAAEPACHAITVSVAAMIAPTPVREAVEPVDQVDRVGDAHDPERGHDPGEPRSGSSSISSVTGRSGGRCGSRTRSRSPPRRAGPRASAGRRGRSGRRGRRARAEQAAEQQAAPVAASRLGSLDERAPATRPTSRPSATASPPSSGMFGAPVHRARRSGGPRRRARPPGAPRAASRRRDTANATRERDEASSSASIAPHGPRRAALGAAAARRGCSAQRSRSAPDLRSRPVQHQAQEPAPSIQDLERRLDVLALRGVGRAPRTRSPSHRSHTAFASGNPSVRGVSRITRS